MRKQVLHPLTEKINKKQKMKAKQSRHEALNWLAKTFPHAFDDTLSIHPLKVGIMNDILAHAEQAATVGISKTKLREAVILFTRKMDYLACVKARELRVDLNGEPTVQVSEAEAAQAAEKIKKHIEKSLKMAPKTSMGQSASPSKSLRSPVHVSGDREGRYESTFETTNQTARTTTVVVKNKSNKTFDPDAVARLKEKLGLPQPI